MTLVEDTIITEIERKALALVNEVRAELGGNWAPRKKPYGHEAFQALRRAIEQHEAFAQEVSDAAEQAVAFLGTQSEKTHRGRLAIALARFIIAKPVDPLVEAMTEAFSGSGAWEPCDTADANALRAAIEKRGGKIVWGEG